MITNSLAVRRADKAPPKQALPYEVCGAGTHPKNGILDLRGKEDSHTTIPVLLQFPVQVLQDQLSHTYSLLNLS
jgi:hypothetical protein